jgi:hypothetical protein
MDFSLRRPRFPTTLEKWYVDALFDDGTVLIVYMGCLWLAGRRVARVAATLFRADGSTVSGDAVARDVRGGPDELRFGPASIRGDAFRFDTRELAADLEYRPRYEPCTLRAPFIEEAGRELTWVVEIPDADVRGTLRVGGETFTVAGRGYRDRVAFDLLPWRFPIRTLEWGRAVAGPHAATWVRASTARADVAAAWKDGREVTTPAAGIVIGDSRVLVDGDVLGLDNLRLGVVRPWLARLAGHPRQTKLGARCTIDGIDGHAVHERVTWRSAGVSRI